MLEVVRTRFLAAPLGAAFLFMLALPSVGWLDLPFLPAAPWTLPPFLVATLLIGAWVVVGDAKRPLVGLFVWLALVAPFYAFAAWALPGRPALVWPPVGASLLLGLAFLAVWLPTAWRPRVAIGVLAWALLSVPLAGAGVVVWPEAWPLLPAGSAADSPVVAEPQGIAAEGLVGLRTGRATRWWADEPPPLGEGPGPWWVDAVRGRHDGRRPAILPLDDDASRWAATLPTATWLAWPERGPAAALDLEPVDVVVASATAARTNLPRESAEAIAAWVRGGGALVLVGRGTDEDEDAGTLPWPATLARTLGRAGREAELGPAGATWLGAGRIWRSIDGAHLHDELLEQGAFASDVATVFDGASSAPAAPLELARWLDRPEERRLAGVVLLLFVAGVAAFVWLLRDPRALIAALVGLAGVVVVATPWFVPVRSPVELHALRIDRGGPGGRRIEGVLVAAAPTGWQGEVRWSGGGYVRALGAAPVGEGRWAVAGGGVAWFVRESEVGSPDPADREAPRAAFLPRFLVGAPSPARLRVGRGPRLAVRLEGEVVPPAWTLAVAPPGGR